MRDFLEETIQKVKELDISDVIESYIELPKRTGYEYLGICPFHNDTRLGSFKVNPTKGIFKCFACGKGGDAINFVSLKRGVSNEEAAIIIAKDYQLISMDEYESFMDRKKSKVGIKGIRLLNKEKTNKNNKNDEEVLSDYISDIVFNIILDELELKDEDMNYLIYERQISKQIIEKRKYKSSRTSDDGFTAKIINRVKNELRGEDVEKILKITPGFFKHFINNKWEWMLSRQSGIYIPIRNYKGKIVGLQIRKSKDNKYENRYSWFSSSFCIGKKDYKYGTSQKSRIDVIYPEEISSNSIIITEGRFKSEAIVEKIGVISLSIQGVNGGVGIESVLKDIEEEINIKFDNVCFAFDMDKEHKNEVYNALKDMSDLLVREFSDKEFYYVEWDRKDKGIDDFLLKISCKEEIYKFIEVEKKEEWDIEYSKQVSDLLDIKKVQDIKNLNKEDIIQNIDVSAALKRRRGQL